MSPPRWVMIFGSPGRTLSAYSVSPRSSSRRSASAAAGASARLVTMMRAPVWSASRAAFRGGRAALARLGTPGYMRWKGQRDVVVEASLDVQEQIVAVLQKECPDDAILVEEGPEDEPLSVDAARLWIVDPICGSL